MKQKNFFEVARCRWSLMVAVACGVIGLPLTAAADQIFTPSSTSEAPLGGAMVTGEAVALTATGLQLELRNGKLITVDLGDARQNHLVSPIFIGEYLVVQGSLSAGVMTAKAAYRAKSNPDAWMPDIP